MSSESRHDAPHRRERTVSSAVSVYLIVLLGLQIFLLTVALDALLGYDPGMAWAAGATTLIVSLGILREPWQLLALMAAVGLLTVQGYVINRLAGIPYPAWRAPGAPPT